jgi:hypothetical protein
MTTAKKAAAKKTAPSKRAAAKKAADEKRTHASSAIDTQIVKVTPEMATKWLEDNLVNRNIRPKVVAAYRRDMENGRWEFTGETIQRSASGALLNGQHRLHALAGSEGVDHIEMLVVSGLPDKTQSLMDQGVARHIRDAMLIEHGHIKNSTTVASICRWMVLCPDCGPGTTPSALRNKVSAAEVVDLFAQETGLFIRAGEEAVRLRHYMLGSPTAMGYAWMSLFKVSPEDCTEFFAGMRDMEWSMPNDPRKAALRRMQLMHGDENIKTTLETGVMTISVLSRAWNHWRKGEEVESLNIRSRTGIILPVTPI